MAYYKSKVPEKEEIVACTFEREEELGVYVHVHEYDMEGFIELSKFHHKRHKATALVREYRKKPLWIGVIDSEHDIPDVSIFGESEETREKLLDRFDNMTKYRNMLNNLMGSVDTECNPEAVYERMFYPHYGPITDLSDQYLRFQDVLANPDKYILNDEMLSICAERITQKPAKIDAEFDLVVFEPNSLELLRTALSGADGRVLYGEAPRYHLVVTAKTVPECTELLTRSWDRVRASLAGKRHVFSADPARQNVTQVVYNY